jgi:inner membrane protein
MGGFSFLSLLPDADVLAFKLGIPYSAPFGHRGAAHSLTVAAALGLVCGLAAWMAGRKGLRTGLLACAVPASHGLLDTLTDGGLGIALHWPFSEARFFAPWRPLPVSPIGFDFLSVRGIEIALIELAGFLPLFVYALWPRGHGVKEMETT